MAGAGTLELMREWVDAFNRGDRERFMAMLADDAVEKSQAIGIEFKGPEKMTRWFWNWRSPFPDLRWEIVDSFADGDRGVLELMWNGTHQGELKTPDATIPPTGRSVAFPQCFVVTTREGKIARIVVYTDRMTTLTQLGALHTPEGAH